MNKFIENYLDELKEALVELDKSTVQDALTDAEDHLTTALLVETEERPDESSKDIVLSIIEKYGSPEDILDRSFS